MKVKFETVQKPDATPIKEQLVETGWYRGQIRGFSDALFYVNQPAKLAWILVHYLTDSRPSSVAVTPIPLAPMTSIDTISAKRVDFDLVIFQ